MEPDGWQLYVWEAGMFSGVTDDEATAKDNAAECLRRGETARVECCMFASGYRRMSTDHIRLGCGWTTTRPTRGPMTWVPFGEAVVVAAS